MKLLQLLHLVTVVKCEVTLKDKNEQNVYPGVTSVANNYLDLQLIRFREITIAEENVLLQKI